MIELSIIIPFNKINKVFFNSINHAHKISKKINCEIIYVYDGKIKNFVNVKKKIEFKSDKIYLYQTGIKSMGPGIPRNFGIKSSKADKIIFLDVDDFLIINNLSKLLKIKNLNKYNLIYYNYLLFNKRNKKMSNQFLNYSKKSIAKFLTSSSNNMVILILFKKKFLLENKIKFNKGIFEDIFFVFKCHFFNTKKIFEFKLPVYKKINFKNSITNTLTKNHIYFMHKAWQDIHYFIKKNLNKNIYIRIQDNIYFRMRGQFYNDYMKLKLIKNDVKKNKLIKYTYNIYKFYLKKEFTPKSKKDLLVKKLISNKKLVNV